MGTDTFFSPPNKAVAPHINMNQQFPNSKKIHPDISLVFPKTQKNQQAYISKTQ